MPESANLDSKVSAETGQRKGPSGLTRDEETRDSISVQVYVTEEREMGSQGGAAPLQEANSSSVGLPFTSPYRRAHYSNASIRMLLTIPGRECAACLLFGLTASPSLWLSESANRSASSAPASRPVLRPLRVPETCYQTYAYSPNPKKTHWLDGPPQLLLRTKRSCTDNLRLTTASSCSTPLRSVRASLLWPPGIRAMSHRRGRRRHHRCCDPSML